MQSPAPFTATGSRGVRTRNWPVSSDASISTASSGVSSVCSDVTMTARGPRSCTASTASRTAAQRLRLAACDVIELELVGRDDIGRRHRLVAHELGNALAHENAAADVADHRVAAIARGRIGALHASRPRRGWHSRSRPRPYSRTARRRIRRARRASRCRPPARDDAARTPGRSSRHSRYDWRTARYGSAILRRPIRCNGNTAAELPTWP